MEVFDVEEATDNHIVLKTEKQLETLFAEITKEQPVMIRWVDEDENGDECNMSRLLITEGLMARLKDGRFILKSEELTE